MTEVQDFVQVDDDGVVVHGFAVFRVDGKTTPTPPGLRRLTGTERSLGVTVGWRRAANGKFVDERPAPPEAEPAKSNPT